MVQLPEHTRTYSHIQTRHLNIEIIACLHFIPNQCLQFTFVWSTSMYLQLVKASSSSSSTQFPPLHFLSQFIINMNLRGEISEVVYFFVCDVQPLSCVYIWFWSARAAGFITSFCVLYLLISPDHKLLLFSGDLQCFLSAMLQSAAMWKQDILRLLLK